MSCQGSRDYPKGFVGHNKHKMKQRKEISSKCGNKMVLGGNNYKGWDNEGYYWQPKFILDLKCIVIITLFAKEFIIY